MAKNISEARERKEALFLSRTHYQTFFNDSPVPLWEEEFGELYAYLEELKGKGVRDFRTYFDKNPAELSICAQKVEILDVNQATLKLHNAKNKEELLGNLDKIFTEKSFDVFKEEIIALAAGQLEFESEAEVKTITGESINISLRLRINKDQPGSIRALLATTDITEQVRSQKKLKESEEKFSKAFYNHPTPMQIANAKTGERIDINESAIRLYGYSQEEIQKGREEILQGNLYSDTIAVDPEKQKRLLEKLLKVRLISNYSLDIITISGEIRNLLVSLALLDIGDGNWVLAAFVDITERKQIEQALKDSEEKFRTLFAQARDGIVVADSETGQIVECNHEFEELTGRSGEQLKQIKIWEVLPPDERDIAKKTFFQIQEMGSAEPTELLFQTPDGQVVPIEFTSRRIRIGDKAYLQSIARDITDRKRAERALKKAYNEMEGKVRERTAELSAKNEQLKAFAFTVSHDLKAPLRGISGYARELQRRHKNGLNERGQHCVEEVTSSSLELENLIEDLLRYSRLEAEEIETDEVDVRAMVAEILREIIGGRENGCQISTDISFSKITCWPRGLSQILMNLIDNAVKYSSGAEPPEIKVRGVETPTAYRLSVADNGIGFDMKHQDRIFQLFHRLTPGQEIEGTGAGLAIVKKLVEKQGGKVWAESQLGKGATFFVELPKTRSANSK